MAGDEPFDILRIPRTYTLNEAVELMKRMDRYATGNNINWVDAETGKPVAIGYND